MNDSSGEVNESSSEDMTESAAKSTGQDNCSEISSDISTPMYEMIVANNNGYIIIDHHQY